MALYKCQVRGINITTEKSSFVGCYEALGFVKFNSS